MDDIGCWWTVWEGHGNTPGLAATGVARPEDEPSREVIEVALAHVVDNHVELAYARYDLFDRRRVLMDDRARYLDGRSGEGRESL